MQIGPGIFHARNSGLSVGARRLVRPHRRLQGCPFASNSALYPPYIVPDENDAAYGGAPIDEVIGAMRDAGGLGPLPVCLEARVRVATLGRLDPGEFNAAVGDGVPIDIALERSEER